jgi:hypothetical protein
MIHCIDDRDPPSMVATEHLIISVPAEITDNKRYRQKFVDVHLKFNIRPGLMESLRELSKIFQVVAFTASE